MNTLVYFLYFKNHLIPAEKFFHCLTCIDIMCTPPLPRPFLSAGEVEPTTKFSKKGGLDRISVFRGGLLGKRG